eukprot:CAMPEP_0176358868 /NCGR_PEP_ID=MMETSP0126-20121128/15894_1 /TAXON_ID=141414 ORGANISM="Strombidinopsis acuminatum, Strain SPMC142" /NCGR_SAMPLE_ID=MMETSP0126 /ASSEMBLY_ACC=CAM_ASM_000229 /LENGTH=146 /DNA_ID=CAMNT_0017713287 /DNA_START=1246 /DNA_END=1686 /DNA_ORIENTATION=-
MTYKDGSIYAGFFYENNPHGIGVKTDSKNIKVFTVHDKGRKLCELTPAEVDAVNDGTKHIPQMDVFFKDYYDDCGSKPFKPSDLFGYKDVKELNFIENEDRRHKMCLLSEDLEAIALKNGMDKHELDPETDEKIQKHLDAGDDKLK